MSNFRPSLLNMQNGIASWENSLAVSYEIKYALNVFTRHLSPRYVAKRNENMCPHTDLCMSGCRSFNSE